MKHIEQAHAQYMAQIETPVTPSTVSEAFMAGYKANTHVISVQEFENALNNWYNDGFRSDISFEIEIRSLFPNLSIKMNHETKKWFVEQCL